MTDRQAPCDHDIRVSQGRPGLGRALAAAARFGADLTPETARRARACSRLTPVAAVEPVKTALLEFVHCTFTIVVISTTTMMKPPTSPVPSPNLVLERFMRAMFTQIITALARSLRTQNLSVAEIAALHLIDRERTLRVSDLAVQLDADLPTASRIASRLVAEGLVDRQEDPDDRRARLLTLTAKGRALIDRTSKERVKTAFATAQSMPGAVVDTIGPAMQQLIDLERSRGKRPKAR